MSSATDLTIEDYRSTALEAEQKGPEMVTFEFALLGLFGETGSLLSAVKKKQRDTASFAGYEEVVLEELGDVLWYLNTVSNRGGVSLTEIANLLKADGIGLPISQNKTLKFLELQPSAKGLQSGPSKEFEKTLLTLAGQVGILVADHGAGRLTDNRTGLVSALVSVFRLLIQAASEAGVLIAKAAHDNLAKIADRWPSKRLYGEIVDAQLEDYEQLPRELVIDIFEEPAGTTTQKKYVYQRTHKINIGDRLTDNIEEPDDYRFHDVFHYAYVAVLGWSPVMRALLKVKRKSLPLKDEAEDGARANLIEEGITTWIFNQAKSLNFFEGVARGHLSFELLKTVRRFTKGYEPEKTPLWKWEEAILQGYEAFRFLQLHRRGRVTINMNAHTLSIELLPK